MRGFEPGDKVVRKPDAPGGWWLNLCKRHDADPSGVFVVTRCNNSSLSLTAFPQCTCDAKQFELYKAPDVICANTQPPPSTAAHYCQAALGHMEDRATTYDAPAGERSMAKTVAAFNALTGHSLTEEQGWLFMEVLKLARSQQGNFKRDNYEDAVAYAALRGEAAEKERQQ